MEYILPDCYFKDKLCFFPALHPLGGFWSKSRNREDARFRQNLTGFFEFPPKGRRAYTFQDEGKSYLIDFIIYRQISLFVEKRHVLETEKRTKMG